VGSLIRFQKLKVLESWTLIMSLFLLILYSHVSWQLSLLILIASGRVHALLVSVRRILYNQDFR
jgi:hypothetical protein